MDSHGAIAIKVNKAYCIFRALINSFLKKHIHNVTNFHLLLSVGVVVSRSYFFDAFYSF